MAINVPPQGDEQRRTLTHWANLLVKAQDSPALTVQVDAGGYWLNDVTYIEFAGGSSPGLTAPGTSARWTLIVLNTSGNLALVVGSIAATPSLPTPGTNQVVLAGVLMNVGDTEITNDMVFDLRSTIRLGGQLVAASVGSVTGLASALDEKASITSVTNGLALKADNSGTPDPVFTLNANHTGAAVSTAKLEVERGAETNVFIQFNEASNIWQFTNDGTLIQDFSVLSASDIAGIAVNTSNIAVLQASVVVADAGIAANASAIVVLQASIAAVDDNASAIGTNTAAIGVLQASATAHHSSISSNASAIVVLVTDIATVSAIGTTNATNIANNASDIVVLQGSVTTHHTSIANNASNIAVNLSQIDDNASSIAVLQGSVTTHHTNIGINSSNIAVNLSQISDNASAIGTNATGVSAASAVGTANAAAAAAASAVGTANAAAIVVNVSAIADNASAIGTNATAVSAASAVGTANAAAAAAASAVGTSNTTAIAANASAIVVASAVGTTNAATGADNASAIGVLEAATHPYDLHGYSPGTLSASTDLYAWVANRTFTIPTQSALIRAAVGAGGDNSDFNFLHDAGGGASVIATGTVASAVAAGTLVFAGPVVVGPGDFLVFRTDASVDAALADIAVGITGEV